MTIRLCRACGGWHDLGQPWPEQCHTHFASRTETKLHVISDTMDAARHPATGRMTDSKSQFRADTRAAGCVEVGNEPIRAQERPKLSNPRAELARKLEGYH